MSDPSADLSTAIPRACSALASHLNEAQGVYAIIGGGACTLLGSNRTTLDIDIVVPKDHIKTTRRLLAATTDFEVDARTLHTTYEGIDVEILAPPRMYLGDFDANTPTHNVDVGGVSVRVLHPVILLNNKLRVIGGRATQDRKVSDYQDIVFLLSRLVALEV
jgi:hypothetical protein